MPRYSYKAYTKSGALTAGEVSASTRGGALDAIAHRGQIPLEVKEDGPAEALPWWQREVFTGSQIAATQLALYTRELASLAKAELPTDDVLRIVAVQPAIPPRLRLITTNVAERVREGQALSEAFAAQGAAFPEYFWRLIKAGEAGGSLATTLDELAVLFERSAEVRAQTVSSLVYPAILVAAAIGAIAVITSVLLPALLPIFADANATPPRPVQFLASLHDAVARYWPLIVAAIAGCFAMVAAAARNPALRLRLDGLKLHLPVVGRFIRERETARFSRTFSTLVRNGVPILDAVTTAAGVVSNSVYASTIAAAAEDIRQGSVLSRPLGKSGLFPDLFMRLAIVGEETGHVDQMHLRAAEIYEASQQRQVQRLTALVTPVLTLLIGGVVGGLILSVMGAILSLNELAIR
jgi:general secretion pathway protein F